MSDWEPKELTRMDLIADLGCRFKTRGGSGVTGVSVVRDQFNSVTLSTAYGGVSLGMTLTPDTAEAVGRALIEYAGYARE